jgi:hypothetical protein
VTAAPPRDSSLLERAELLFERVEEEAAHVAKSALAHVLELAEDVWAEAQSVRKSSAKH